MKPKYKVGDKFGSMSGFWHIIKVIKQKPQIYMLKLEDSEKIEIVSEKILDQIKKTK